MTAKINNAGNLEVERAGEMKPQYCPYSSYSTAMAVAPGRNDSWIQATHEAKKDPCGDWCPRFNDTSAQPVPEHEEKTIFCNEGEMVTVPAQTGTLFLMCVADHVGIDITADERGKG